MVKQTLLLIAFLLMIGTAFADFSDNYITINVGDTNGLFTEKRIANGNYIIATDKIMYASSEGEVNIKAYIQSKVEAKGIKVQIKTTNKNIQIKSVKSGLNTDSKLSALTKEYETPFTINLVAGKVNEVDIVLTFNPKDIGVGEEFDIIIVDSTTGTIIEKLDPFLSGYPYRQAYTLSLTALKLSSVVNTNHTLFMNIPITNTSFWTHHTCTDANGIAITQSDGLTEMKWEEGGWNDNVDGNIYYQHDEQFSTTDKVIYLYYGGSCAVNTSDGTAVWDSDLNAVWLMNENSSTAETDATSNTFDLTHVNTPTPNQGGKVDKSVLYTETSSEYSKNDGFMDGELGNFSFSIWFNAAEAQTAWAGLISKVNASGANEPIRLRFTDTGAINWLLREDSTDTSTTTTTTSWTNGVWYNIIGTRNSATGETILYVNGTMNVTTAGSTGDVHGGTTGDFEIGRGAGDVVYFDGRIDETRIYNSVLTANDVNILYAGMTGALGSFGTEQAGASFSYSVGAYSNVLGYSIITLTNTSTNLGVTTTYQWLIDSVNYSTDENTTVSKGIGDYNITLRVTADGNVYESSQTVSVVYVPASLNAHFDSNRLITVISPPSSIPRAYDVNYLHLTAGNDLNINLLLFPIGRLSFLFGKDGNQIYEIDTTGLSGDVNEVFIDIQPLLQTLTSVEVLSMNGSPLKDAKVRVEAIGTDLNNTKYRVLDQKYTDQGGITSFYVDTRPIQITVSKSGYVTYTQKFEYPFIHALVSRAIPIRLQEEGQTVRKTLVLIINPSDGNYFEPMFVGIGAIKQEYPVEPMTIKVYTNGVETTTGVTSSVYLNTVYARIYATPSNVYRFDVIRVSDSNVITSHTFRYNPVGKVNDFKEEANKDLAGTAFIMAITAIILGALGKYTIGAGAAVLMITLLIFTFLNPTWFLGLGFIAIITFSADFIRRFLR